MSAPTPTGTTAVDADVYTAVATFLAREARLLDEGREEEWFELLADDLLYTIPIRQAAEPRTAEINRSAFRLRDNKMNVRTRLNRLATGHAYSEVPPSRTMRLVGSVEVSPGPGPDLVDVSSALLVYRQRGIDPHFDLIPCRRNDRLRWTGEGLRLVSREVILTETSLLTPNLGVLL
ncbi:aromatic-ring-hydroxylating dioxygenase subunit beta [Acrocarpospora macrocephala]|uniref:Aromatic-ring-hydroxylating dioxygenase subunit beta n=1 Tax=Acrocarpospora macrocephala TaxID=150177 RepID=A0A5M3WQP2_9ACTN|nr:aromatic-ring-hydroxylating dioxygenase subunit beta [Acrocarpospora macrocephala]GES09073.1 aromatic-ring-hydroxylating dioxygenase subunit beta [Acrocarpospora macrocephala]